MGLIFKIIFSVFLISQNAYESNNTKVFLAIDDNPVNNLEVETLKYPNQKDSSIETLHSNGEFFFTGFENGYYFLKFNPIQIKNETEKLEGIVFVNGKANCCMRVSLQFMDGKPIKESSTGEDGKFYFTDIPAGNYKLLITVNFSEFAHN
jgi:hypothetical protein